MAQIQNNEIYHYHLDHLGTPQELTNNRGDIVWSAHYKTYGNLALKEVDDVENNLRFQGQYFDEESGLHYNRHRYYNPNTGQFTQQDPIGLLGGLNNYQYVPNPVGWVDPFGLKSKDCPPVETIDGKKIVYFSKDDIKVKKMYGGDEYFFYVDKEGDMLELAYTTVDKEKSSLEFYINNQFNKNILMKPDGFGMTDEILSRSVKMYSDDTGTTPESLDGTIIKKNLSNFQKEYKAIKEASPDISDENAATEAIKKISFGKSRIKLGYSDIEVDIRRKGDVDVDGETLKDVPTGVKISSKLPKKDDN